LARPYGARQRAEKTVARLKEIYPAICELDFETPYQLLVATILSAQSTDKMVNKVTPKLFEGWPAPADLAAADPAEVEALIKPTGFFREKTKAIQGSAAALVERFGGEVPPRMEDLTTLPGVGRKTANVVLGVAFGVPALRRRHPRHPALQPAPAHRQQGPGPDREGRLRGRPAGGVDGTLAPADPPRPAGLRREAAEMRRMRPERLLPLFDHPRYEQTF